MTAPVAVVTGASSGIGYATAQEFARQGYAVVVAARRKELLDGLVAELSRSHPKSQFLALACNVSDWAQVLSTANEVQQRFGKINVLVNNAGAFDFGLFEKADVNKMNLMIDVNVRGTVYVTRAFLPLLKAAVEKKERAKIVSVSSIAGLWGFSHMSVYTATKFAVTGLTEALRRELAPQGIGVASIHPGPVRSKEPPGPKQPKKAMVMLPPQVAKQIFRLSQSGKSRLISRWVLAVLYRIEPWFPQWVDKVLKRIL